MTCKMMNTKFMKTAIENDRFEKYELIPTKLRYLKYKNGYAIFLGCCITWLSSCQTTKVTSDAVENGGQNSSYTYKRSALTVQEKKGWPWMDLAADSIPGISLNRAYDFLKDKEASEVVTAIIDSGIDTEHKALRSNVWINENEIAGNNVDDDDNGYIDDVNGWNFLDEVYYAPMEMTRLVARWKKRFEGKDVSSLTSDDHEVFQSYQQVRKAFDRKSSEITSELKKNARHYSADAPKRFQEYYEHLQAQNEHHYNLDFDPRKEIGDDVYDLTDTQYGDNNVAPRHENESHGTHVAGIFTAIVKEIPERNIKFMPIRNTPDGDEYDKDVALAIRYAADNGARVINMSFGKAFADRPDWVYDAIRYAAEKDVLIVHGAGNNTEDTDSVMVYPNDHKGTASEIVANFVAVGSITRYYNEAMISDFSNYGVRNVDIFAPGSDIYSAMPGNKYEYQNGTSMAAPMVAAVASLVRAYFPDLSASQVKHIIMESGTKVPFNVWMHGEVIVERPFSEICKSARILNAYNALLMADKLSKKNENQ